ncbi:MAG TPA: tetratricopeptide repeat protein [Mariprofundaceae bacterium]|nr:tetratricopeptide repeat protein [Mariprofundaceae bacterium]
MTTLLLSALLAAVVVLLWLLWQQRQQEETLEQAQEDVRISPLLRGINYLLSDQPDRALRELVHVARIHTETAEVYLALGGMFRSKGEFGRAVRIHQNLLARPDLPDSLHQQAQFALAHDFQAGGLLGRALSQYAKVLELQPDHVQALEASLRIHEQSSEWEKAEDLLLRLDRIRGTSSSLHQSYLIAEMAKEHQMKGDTSGAIELAERAIAMDPACAAAHLLLTELHLASRDKAAAFECMRNLQEAVPQYTLLLVPLLLRYTDVYHGQGSDFLRSCWDATHDEALVLAWIEGVHTTYGVEAVRKLMGELGFEPKTLRACLRVEAITADEDTGLAQASRVWRQSARNFSCSHCGMEVVEMRWQCPRCHQWGSMLPISGNTL